MRRSVSRFHRQSSNAILPFKSIGQFKEFTIKDLDPEKALETGKIMTGAWANSLAEEEREKLGLNFI